MILGENHSFLSLRKSVRFDIITGHQKNTLRIFPQGVFLALRESTSRLCSFSLQLRQTR